MNAGAALTVAVRFASYVDLVLLFGIAAFALPIGGRPARLGDPRRWLVGGALLGILLTGAGAVLLAASMTGLALAAVDPPALATVLAIPTIGGAIAIRIGALLIVALLALFARAPAVRGWPIVLAAGGALASLGWIGHGAMDAGALGWLHVVANMLHLLAAGAWIGAIVGLLAMVVRARRRPSPARLEQGWSALAGFARTGTLLVGVILLTGVINVWAIIGPANFPTLPATRYGQLLLIKLVLFAAMLALASYNRFGHVPRLRETIDRGGPRLAGLRRCLLAEAVCGVVVLGVVAWLGILDPAGGD